MNHERQSTNFGERVPPLSPPSIQPLLVSVDEAATALRLGRTKVYALMGAGVISFIKIGKRRLVPVSSLRALVDQLSGQGVIE